MYHHDKASLSNENAPPPQTSIPSRNPPPPQNPSFHPKQTPLPSSRRSRLARELLSNQKDAPNSSLKIPNIPPSTIIRNRFNHLLNGTSSISQNSAKRKRLILNPNDIPSLSHDLHTPIRPKNDNHLETNFFSSIFEKRANLLNENPLINPVFDTPLNRGFSDNDNSNLSNSPIVRNRSPPTGPFPQINNNPQTYTPSNENEYDWDSDNKILKTPLNLRSKTATKAIDSIARPGSAIRKMLDDSLKESQRISELEKARQQANKASYENKRLSLELKKSKLEHDSVVAELRNKLDSRDKKIDTLEKERDWLFNKEKSASESLKLAEDNNSSSKKNYENIISQLKDHINDENELRIEQEQKFETDRSNFISQVNNLELRLVKVEKYKSLMEKQLCSIILNSDNSLDPSTVSSFGWQKIVETIQEVISSKNLQISKLKIHSSASTQFDPSDDQVLKDLQDFFNSANNSPIITKSISYIQYLKKQIEFFERETSITLSESNKLKIENDSLKNSLISLKHQVDDVNLIKERNLDLESKLSRLEHTQLELAKLEAEYKTLLQEQERWYFFPYNFHFLFFILFSNDINPYSAKSLYFFIALLRNSMFKNEPENDISNDITSPYQAANLVLNLRNELAKQNEKLGELSAKNSLYSSQLIECEAKIDDLNELVSNLETKLIDTTNKLIRSEKSKAGTIREVSTLKAQLDSYDFEEAHMMKGNYDTVKADRIKHLKDHIYNQQLHIMELEKSMELEYLNKLNLTPEELEDLKKRVLFSSQVKDNLVKSHNSVTEFETNSNILELQTQYDKALSQSIQHQETIKQLTLEKSNLSRELETADKQLAILEYRVGKGDHNPETTRVLMLADNPSSRDYAIRKERLENLKEENSQLLEQLKTALDTLSKYSNSAQTINSTHETNVSNNELDLSLNPTTYDNVIQSKDEIKPLDSGLFKTISNLKADNKALIDKLANSKIAIKRLKEVWRAKALELREAVCSLLGYQVDFLENGRVRLTSIYAESNMNSFLFSSNSHNKGTIELLGGGNKDYLTSVQADISNLVE
ncbi:Spindle assembly checkpoint component MAD1 [Smittium culicis]|uniref:Spindle assembly checkpoint component MAD1 n=1 Tax=Smittium culicis TaxID=133412 RepID=A0A1R1Y839_9FUNG|nr:Spindle assembly checkpoint component MAD1 [Smittium culicis]